MPQDRFERWSWIGLSLIQQTLGCSKGKGPFAWKEEDNLHEAASQQLQVCKHLEVIMFIFSLQEEDREVYNANRHN